MTSTSQFTEYSPSFDAPSKHTTVPAHGTATVTSLLIIRDTVVTASDDHSIHVYSARDASLLHELTGHSGGVWGLAAHDDTLVSASGDHTVRVWDLRTGECRHIFGGHTSTIRTVAIAYPDSIAGVDKPLIVSGSRDHLLKVWTLPSRDEESYQYGGHEGEVRDISVGGRQVASGSYDKSVRLWDILSGECVWTFQGHTEKVYCVILDPSRKQVYSSSMDSTVRIWDTVTGQSKYVLSEHTSLVGVLSLSNPYLVSAAPDTRVVLWDPETAERRFLLQGHKGAITCVAHNSSKILSGSRGSLKWWDAKTGEEVRELLSEIDGVWKVGLSERWCAAAVNRDGKTYLDVWDLL